MQVKHNPISSKFMAESVLRKARMVDLGTVPCSRHSLGQHTWIFQCIKE